MSVAAARPSGSPKAEAEWVRKHEAVEFFRSRGFDKFTVETLKHYSYETDLLPRPKVVGRHAYWCVADLQQLLEAL